MARYLREAASACHRGGATEIPRNPHICPHGNAPRRPALAGNIEEQDMNDQNRGFGLALGAFVVAAALVFIVTGGSLGGKKTVEGDQDLPPIAETTPAK
jgi:hypothetical protein